MILIELLTKEHFLQSFWGPNVFGLQNYGTKLFTIPGKHNQPILFLFQKCGYSPGAVQIHHMDKVSLLECGFQVLTPVRTFMRVEKKKSQKGLAHK